MTTLKPTPQQEACVAAMHQQDMLKIEAVAGAGKSSTLRLIAESMPVKSMYVAFNKAAATEAAAKFPPHVECRTTHSLAYAAYGRALQGKLTRPAGNYVNVAATGSEIARYYRLPHFEDSGVVVLTSAFIGLLVRTTVARYEQSADSVIGGQHVPLADLYDKLKSDKRAINEVANDVLKFAKQMWADRINVRKPVLATHDTYLKLFQLSKPVFEGIKVLYVDEAQDSTPCVLDIVLNQKAHMKIVLVGDARQSIYQFRGSINAMKVVDCPRAWLTKSFRYGKAVADVATAVLGNTVEVEGSEHVASVAGLYGIVDRDKPHTRLFRTNAALLAVAYDAIVKGLPVSVEVDIKGYANMLKSAQELKAGNLKGVKHDRILAFPTWEAMLDECESDKELARVVNMVMSDSVDEYIRVLSSHRNSPEPLITFTTSHRAKGREWAQVVMEDDFPGVFNNKGQRVELPEEEINLLYVAVTRAIERLEYNETVMDIIVGGNK